MKKRILSIILAVAMIMSTMTIGISAAEFQKADEPVMDSAVSENIDVMTVDEYIYDRVSEGVSNVVDAAFSDVQTQANASSTSSFWQKIVDFFADLFGIYKIKDEKKLIKAAKEGGDKWKLTKDFEVTSNIQISNGKQLTINGNNHTITCKTDGIALKVCSNCTLTLKNTNLKCFTDTAIINEGGCYLDNSYVQSDQGYPLYTTGYSQINSSKLVSYAVDSAGLMCAHSSQTDINNSRFESCNNTDFGSSIWLYDTSKIKMQGGWTASVIIHEKCTFVMWDGTVENVYNYAGAWCEVRGGQIDEFHNNSSIDMYNGLIKVLNNNGTFNEIGGTINIVNNYSNFNISGGTVETVKVYSGNYKNNGGNVKELVDCRLASTETNYVDNYILYVKAKGSSSFVKLDEYKIGTTFFNYNSTGTKSSIGGDWSDYPYVKINIGGTATYKKVGAAQCFGYARYVQLKLYGSCGLDGSKYTKDYITRQPKTTAELKALIQKYGVGAHIRTGSNQYGYRHSMIVLGCNDIGFTIVDANNDRANGIQIRRYTWSEYLTSNYGKRGIEYMEYYSG